MVMKSTEEYATLAALSAIFDMQQFMTLEVMSCSERSFAHVARKGRLVNTLVLGEIGLGCEEFSAIFTDMFVSVFMKLFVFYEL